MIDPLYFSATNHLSRRITRLATTARDTSIVLLFLVDRDTHEFFCRLQSNVFYTGICFKPITWYTEMHHVRTFILFVVMTFLYYVMFIDNIFVFLQQGNNLKRAHEKV